MFKEWQEQEGQVSFMSGEEREMFKEWQEQEGQVSYMSGGGEGNVQGVAGTKRTGEFYVGGRREKCLRSGRNKKDR